MHSVPKASAESLINASKDKIIKNKSHQKVQSLEFALKGWDRHRKEIQVKYKNDQTSKHCTVSRGKNNTLFRKMWVGEIPL